jgi:hypothetical protein
MTEDPAGGGGASKADRSGNLIGSEASASSQKRKSAVSVYFAAKRRPMSRVRAAILRGKQIRGRATPGMPRLRFVEKPIEDDEGEK